MEPIGVYRVRARAIGAERAPSWPVMPDSTATLSAEGVILVKDLSLLHHAYLIGTYPLRLRRGLVAGVAGDNRGKPPQASRLPPKSEPPDRIANVRTQFDNTVVVALIRVLGPSRDRCEPFGGIRTVRGTTGVVARVYSYIRPPGAPRSPAVHAVARGCDDVRPIEPSRAIATAKGDERDSPSWKRVGVCAKTSICTDSMNSAIRLEAASLLLLRID
jgi:hypothetical protein